MRPQKVRRPADLRLEDDERRKRNAVGEGAPRPADDERGREQHGHVAIRAQRQAEGSGGGDEPRHDGGTGQARLASQQQLARWAPALCALGAGILAVAVRAPFWQAPLTADEGGYAVVANLWDRGAVLYRGIWVDRPQGLLLAFRALLHLGWTSPEAVRVAAALVAAAIVASTVWLMTRLVGSREGCAAGLLLATLGASPFIESFTLAGELLASLPVVLALVAFAAYLRRPRASWLLLAGLLAGCALTVKQSALDGLVAPAVFLIVARGWPGARRSLAFVAAALVPLAVCALTAPHLGDWWNAVVAYRGQGDSLLTGSPLARLHQLASSLPALAAGLGPLALLAAAGWRSHLLLRLWAGAALLGVLGGGNFHPHYYIQLAPPLACLGGVGAVRLLRERRRLSLAVVAAASVAALAVASTVAVAGPSRQAAAIWPNDPHLRTDAALARWVDAHTGPTEPIYVLWAAADVYDLAHRPPALKYLWYRNVQAIPGALGAARRMLAERRAALVLEVQPADQLDRSGLTELILQAAYRQVAVVEGTRIFAPRRRGA